MNDTSQAGQATFVKRLLIDTNLVPVGNFLDIGCAGLTISNTLPLEALGWRGWLIDNSPEAQKASASRPSQFIFGDATRLDYSFLPPVVDYLSLDVDEAGLSVLFALPLVKTRFRVMTVEHDHYRLGDTLRVPMLSYLAKNGYDVLCSDVCQDGQSFEIWAVHPELVDMDVANLFRQPGPTNWRDILHVA